MQRRKNEIQLVASEPDQTNELLRDTEHALPGNMRAVNNAIALYCHGAFASAASLS